MIWFRTKSSESIIHNLSYLADVDSYFRHERGDDGHNLVTVVINQLRIAPQAAFDYILDLYNKTEAQFLEEWKKIPTYTGPLDLEVRTYCYGLGNWVRANNSWDFEVCF